MARAQHGDRSPVCGDGCFVGGGVDAAGEAGDDGETGLRELVGQLFSRLRAIVGGPPRADDADGVAILRFQFPPYIEQQRWIVGFLQRRGVVLVRLDDDGNPALCRLADLG